jgi:hypothetical protein
MVEQQSPMYEGLSASPSPRSFGEVPALWLKVFRMSEAFFAQEALRASGSSALISVLILAAVTAVLSGVSALVGGGAQATSLLLSDMTPELAGATAAGAGTIALCSVCQGAVQTLLGFYIANGVVYLGARIFGGKGNFGTQTYLQSLFSVPIGIVMGVVSLVLGVLGALISGVAGPSDAVAIVVSLLLLLVSLPFIVYSIVLNVRAVKVTHDLSTGKAIAAIFVPSLVLTVGLACLVIVALAILGPAIGETFEDIVNQMQ